MLPPPALTSAKSITGTRMGWPVPCSQRLALAAPPTSYSAVTATSPPAITLALAVVPPMSKEIRSAMPSWRPISDVATTPAAGPDSTTTAGMRRHSGMSRMPPLLPMTCSGGSLSVAVASARRPR